MVALSEWYYRFKQGNCFIGTVMEHGAIGGVDWRWGFGHVINMFQYFSNVCWKVEFMMWKDKYRINVGLIDQQQKSFLNGFQIFFRWFKAKNPGRSRWERSRRPWYSCRIIWNPHFADEEAYQEQIQYPDLENHRRVHSKFKERDLWLCKIFESEGYTKELVQEFVLMTWLIMHVGKMDQKIGDMFEVRRFSHNESGVHKFLL